MYLKMKARGHSMSDFTSLFKKGDYVHNDHLVGEMVKPLLKPRMTRLKTSTQCNEKCCELDI